jgi:ferredoxin
MPVINNKCIGCTRCVDECAVGAIVAGEDYNYVINQDKCINCGQCIEICDEGAIE